MKLTEFKALSSVKLPENNQVYEISTYGELEYVYEGIIYQVRDIRTITREDWVLVEPTYTTREVFKMLHDGKSMTSCTKDTYKFNLMGELILIYKDGDYEPAILSADELRGLWTEYMGDE